MSAGSSDEIDRAVARAFGRHDEAADPRMVTAFREAGFSEEQARRGAALMESGRYFGFEDVAITLSGGLGGRYDHGNRLIAPNVTPARIAEVARKLGGRTVLNEQRTAERTRSRILESAQARSVGEAMLEACLIDTGEGSSGYYPAATLQAAARERVFHAGTHCYVDHPTESESYERPGRSVRDLAGALMEDASYRDDGLWAKVRVFSSHRDFITERAGVIGLSIRADAEVEERSGGTPTVKRIVQAQSVDFVTKAGRGGRITSWS